MARDTWPLEPQVLTARAAIRRTRSAGYFRGADLLAAFLGGGIAAPARVANVMVDILVGLDHCFENAESTENGIEILRTMDAAVGDGVPTAADDALSVSQATSSLLAAVAGYGGRALAEPERGTWRKAWRSRILAHNRQQLLQCEEGRVANLPGDRTAALEAYLEQFSRTNGLGIALVGIWPFGRSKIGSETLEQIVDVTEPLLRLTQDLIVDMHEARNIGLFLYCAERGVSTAEAKAALRERVVRADLERWLARQWRKRIATAGRQLFELARYSQAREKPAIARLAMTVLLLAAALSPVQYARRSP